VPERIFVSKAEKIMALKLLRTDFLTLVLGYNAARDFRLILLLVDHFENPIALKNVNKASFTRKTKM
jgi:hypothetical protein